MFVTKKRYLLKEDLRDRDYQELWNRYWELRRAYDLLLQHLGLVRVSQPARDVLLPAALKQEEQK